MPVTGVAGSPSLKVSTVGSVHGTPMFCLIRATTSRAVSGCWARGVVGAATNANTTSNADRRMSASDRVRELSTSYWEEGHEFTLYLLLSLLTTCQLSVTIH